MSAPPHQPCGVHLVGSVPLPSVEDVFRQACDALPGRLRRIPDGETGVRHYFVQFQDRVFAHTPVIQRKYDGTQPKTATDDEIDRVVKGMPRLQTGYDEHALSSYSVFRKLREEGTIPPGTRFQVSLPTPVNTIGIHIEPAFRPAIEPLYEGAIVRALNRIQAEIPQQDLAIQWDVAVEFGLLENVFVEPWFEPVREGILERLIRLGDAVADGVELGFHLCYGDMEHKHFKEPKDTNLLVDIATKILGGVKRRVDWIHMPVPRNRDDLEYFAPLERLRECLGSTELYLGLVHAGDEEGTRRRCETARKVVDRFGVGTECGMGRTPPEELTSILQISAAVSSPLF